MDVPWLINPKIIFFCLQMWKLTPGFILPRGTSSPATFLRRTRSILLHSFEEMAIMYQFGTRHSRDRHGIDRVNISQNERLSQLAFFFLSLSLPHHHAPVPAGHLYWFIQYNVWFGTTQSQHTLKIDHNHVSHRPTWFRSHRRHVICRPRQCLEFFFFG